MDDEEFILYRARHEAAEIDEALAEQIESGEADDHWRVRWLTFFYSPSPEPDEEFLKAWNEYAKRRAQ